MGTDTHEEEALCCPVVVTRSVPLAASPGEPGRRGERAGTRALPVTGGGVAAQRPSSAPSATAGSRCLPAQGHPHGCIGKGQRGLEIAFLRLFSGSQLRPLFLKIYEKEKVHTLICAFIQTCMERCTPTGRHGEQKGRQKGKERAKAPGQPADSSAPCAAQARTPTPASPSFPGMLLSWWSSEEKGVGTNRRSSTSCGCLLVRDFVHNVYSSMWRWFTHTAHPASPFTPFPSLPSISPSPSYLRKTYLPTSYCLLFCSLFSI